MNKSITNINQLDTPCVAIDNVIVESNIARFQDYCSSHNIQLRPHIKTHKLPYFANKQVAAGAVGITCQKISEAEIFANEGFDDILITYNILGDQKLERLLNLAKRVNLSVVADSEMVLSGLSNTFANSNLELKVLVECDTGAGRCGVQTPLQAAELAEKINVMPGIKFDGLMTYPPMFKASSVQQWLEQAIAECKAKGLSVNRVSSGGTPDCWHAHEVDATTEFRIGTYIYNDHSLLAANNCSVQDCALKVITTVVSRPTPDRAVIDAGSKALTSDLLGLEEYGYVCEYPEAIISGLSEEHGVIDLSRSTKKPEIGERLSIIPNHACPVSNLFDSVWLHHGGNILSEQKVMARGCVF